MSGILLKWLGGIICFFTCIAFFSIDKIMILPIISGAGLTLAFTDWYEHELRKESLQSDDRS